LTGRVSGAHRLGLPIRFDCSRPVLAALIVLFAASARAQRLEPATTESRILMPAFPPFEEGSALIAYGSDGSARVGVRVGATATEILPGVGSGAATPNTIRAASCGGTRWLLEYDVANHRFAVRSAGGSEIWHVAQGERGFRAVDLRCAGTRPVVGWDDDGELTTVFLSPEVERRTRLAPRGGSRLAWVARGPDEVFATIRPDGSTSTTMLVRLARGAVTHRFDLGTLSEPSLAIAVDQILVAGVHHEQPAVVVQGFAASDLASSPAVTIALPHADRSARVSGLWPTQNGVIVGVVETWRGPDMLHSPYGPSRDEPAHHAEGVLYLVHRVTGAVGPRVELGAEDVGAGVVSGDRFVLLEGGRSGPAASVRRFVLVR